MADHLLLAAWAADCAARVVPIFQGERPGDSRPADAVATARAWAVGECSVGQTRAAAVASHASARDAGQTAALAARACGHAAATAHMADHALGAAFYALLAVAEAEPNDLNAERVWQVESLPKPVSDLVRSDMHLRAAKFAHIFDSPS
ncbi:MAG: putative immunity protein [Actinomycetes bacterium]